MDIKAHRQASALELAEESDQFDFELPEKSDQFRFLRADCLTNLKGSAGLILTKASTMKVSIPLVFSSSFIPLPRFIRSRRLTPLLAPSLVLLPKRHVLGSFSVTLFPWLTTKKLK
jgi:hypothetical protein